MKLPEVFLADLKKIRGYGPLGHREVDKMAALYRLFAFRGCLVEWGPNLLSSSIEEFKQTYLSPARIRLPAMDRQQVSSIRSCFVTVGGLDQYIKHCETVLSRVESDNLLPKEVVDIYRATIDLVVFSDVEFAYSFPVGGKGGHWQTLLIGTSYKGDSLGENYLLAQWNPIGGPIYPVTDITCPHT